MLVGELGGPKGKIGGNVASYVCTPDGEVIHAVAGNVDGKTLGDEIEWALGQWTSLKAAGGAVDAVARARASEAHAARRSRWWGQSAVNHLLTEKPLAPLDDIYPEVWERLLQEFVSDLPVQVVKHDCPEFRTIYYQRRVRHGRRGAAGEALHDALLLHALDCAPSADIDRRVHERLREAMTFRDFAFRVATAARETEIAARLRDRIENDDAFRELCLTTGPRDDGVFAGTVSLLLETGIEDRHAMATRLLSPTFRRRFARAMPEPDQVDLIALLFEGLAGDILTDETAAPSERDPRRVALAGFDEDVVLDGLVAAFSVIRTPDDAAREKALAAVVIDMAGELGESRFARLIGDRRVPIQSVVDVATDDPERAHGLDILVGALADLRGSRQRALQRQLERLDADGRAEVAARLIETLEETSGSRRRQLFRYFAGSTDASGIDTLVRALRWEDGDLMPDAIEALRRVTGIKFAKPSRSKRARARQALEIAWWWSERQHEAGQAANVSAD